MTLQEQAFINWYDNQPTFGVDYQEIWNAACAWQREKDAQICVDLEPDYTKGQGYNINKFNCADAIRNQGT